MGLSAVFAMCARSTERTLPKIVGNLERLSERYDRSAFILVEGDSTDGSKALLETWAQGRPGATVIHTDGFEARFPLRSDRIAACRNAYMDHIRSSDLARYDHLVLLDADKVNEGRIDPTRFTRARDWLIENDAAAVFANSQPVYYDLWALRHPSWCPEDFFGEIEREKARIGKAEAERLYSYERKIPIAETGAPIDVQSAFGGLAIYRLSDALDARYVGLTEDGREVCEHVSFNRDVARSGRRLAILPWLKIGARDFGMNRPHDSRTIPLAQAGRSCSLVAPSGSVSPSGAAACHALPILSRLIEEALGKAVIADLAAGFGEDAARIRMEGVRLRLIAVEPQLTPFKHLILNHASESGLLHDVDAIWARIGASDEAGGWDFRLAPAGTLEQVVASIGLTPARLSLVKLGPGDLAGDVVEGELDFLNRTLPILWAPAQSDPRRLLEATGEGWTKAILFRGGRVRSASSAASMLSRLDAETAPRSGCDLVLFPKRFAPLFRAYVEALAGADDGEPQMCSARP